MTQFPESFDEAFKGLEDWLEDKLDVEFGFLTKLDAKQVIDSKQRIAIQNLQTHQQVVKLIDILKRRPNSCLPDFCDALRETDQKNVLQRITTPRQGDAGDRQHQQQMMTASQHKADAPGFGSTTQAQATLPTVMSSTLTAARSVNVLLTDVNFYNEIVNRSETGMPIDKIYLMNSSLRGIACIISNKLFTGGNLEPREGAEFDLQRLPPLFRQLHFDVRIYEQLNAEDMKRAIRETANDTVSRNGQCYVLFILTHGGKDEAGNEFVYGTDEDKVMKTELLELLSDKNCPHLKEKPRLVFLQACRGDVIGFQADARYQAVQGHFLVCQPTEEGFVSWRHPENGSVYVQCLIDQISQHAHRQHITELVTSTNYTMPASFGGSRIRQVADMSKNTLDKKLYFFPGIVR